MNHRYFIRYFVIAAENRLKCLIPTFSLTTDLYYWELMSLSSRCSQIYSHHDKSQKEACQPQAQEWSTVALILPEIIILVLRLNPQ